MHCQKHCDIEQVNNEIIICRGNWGRWLDIEVFTQVKAHCTAIINTLYRFKYDTSTFMFHVKLLPKCDIFKPPASMREIIAV